VVDPSHVPKQFSDLLALPTELFLVGEVLVLAAAALGEEWTTGLLALRAGREDGQEISL
jgi:hypothetical protein